MANEIIETEASGTIVEYNEDGGYGFLMTADRVNPRHGHHNDADEIGNVFFHISEYPGEHPKEGERFSFMIAETEDGPQAIELEKLDRKTDDRNPKPGRKPFGRRQREQGVVDERRGVRNEDETTTTDHEDSKFQ